MKRLDKETLEVITQAKRHPSGQRLVAWLRESLDKELRDALHTEGEHIVRAQGRCQMLNDIIGIFDDSEHYLARTEAFEVRSQEKKDRNPTVV